MERLEADFFNENSAEINLFHDLLNLLESVEFSELRVEHFDTKFTPIVGKLLHYQATVRAAFKWDHDESVIETGFRPGLHAIEFVWNEITGEAQTFQLSERFLKDVAYLTNAHRALVEGREWRQSLVEIVNGLKNTSLVDKVTIATLKKHVSKWALLAIEVPFDDIVSNASLEAIDEWSRQLSVSINNKAKQRRRATLEEATELMNAAPVPYCTNSADYEVLSGQVKFAQEVKASSIVLITQSYEERCGLVVPNAETVIPENDSLAIEITRLLRESRKTPIRVGTEMLMEVETRIRSINRNLLKILNRPNVVPLETVGPFIESVRQGISVEEDGEIVIPGIVFSPNKRLISAVSEKLEYTTKWRRILEIL